MNTSQPSELLIYLALFRLPLLHYCFPEFLVLYWLYTLFTFFKWLPTSFKGLELVLSQDTVQVDDHVTVVCEEELEGGAMVTTMEELFSPSFHAGVSKAYKWLLVNLQKLSHFETVRATCCFSLRQVNEPEFRWNFIVKSFFEMYCISYHIQYMSKFAKLTRLLRQFFLKITDLKKGWSSDLLFTRAQIWRHLIFDRRHLGKTTLHATGLDLRSDDNESKTYKPFAENPCCHPSHRCFNDAFTYWGLTEKWSHQDDRRKISWISKMK